MAERDLEKLTKTRVAARREGAVKAITLHQPWGSLE